MVTMEDTICLFSVGSRVPTNAAAVALTSSTIAMQAMVMVWDYRGVWVEEASSKQRFVGTGVCLMSSCLPRSREEPPRTAPASSGLDWTHLVSTRLNRVALDWNPSHSSVPHVAFIRPSMQRTSSRCLALPPTSSILPGSQLENPSCLVDIVQLRELSFSSMQAISTARALSTATPASLATRLRPEPWPRRTRARSPWPGSGRR